MMRLRDLIFGIAGLVAASAHGAVVVGSFDITRINYSGGVLETGDYGTLRADLSSRGDTIVSIATLDAASLAGVDVFYTSLLNSSTGLLSGAEQTDLVNWVAAGGTLFAAGDITAYFTAYNTFLNPFGVTIGPTEVGVDAATVVDFTSPITNGPNGSLTAFNFVSGALYSPGSYNTLATYTGGPILIQMNYGLGQVVAVGDHNLFTNSYLGVNEEALFLNILDSAGFSAIPEPGSVALFALGLAGFGVWWRRRR